MGSDRTYSHLPVMAGEVKFFLGCRRGAIYVDGTVGGGGHASEILEATGPDGRVVGIDRDADALEAAGEFLKPYGKRIDLVKGNFRDMGKILSGLGIKEVDGVLLDLGVSSYMLDAPERGFSFRVDAPLDMRMDRTQKVSAKDLVNNLPVGELADIIRRFGEEKRFAPAIARAIDAARKEKPVETTLELAGIVSRAIPRRFHPAKIHPATKTFQALRIAVNEELESLRKGLEEGIGVLAKGGRMCVISYHSLEDRVVKETFREKGTGCTCPPFLPQCVCGKVPLVKILTKKAVTPTEDEVERNPRARSAKLRAVEMM